ncbi:hypothetical protein DP117_03055 [Brasilonema sp. UFV-L1]|nr:hypothetical protein [Brasilonema sp. UFV-L1]
MPFHEDGSVTNIVNSKIWQFSNSFCETSYQLSMNNNLITDNCVLSTVDMQRCSEELYVFASLCKQKKCWVWHLPQPNLLIKSAISDSGISYQFEEEWASPLRGRCANAPLR